MRFSIRDLLWLTVIIGLALGWWLQQRDTNRRYKNVMAHAVRLRTALANAKDAYDQSQTDIQNLMAADGQFSYSYNVFPPADWKLIDEPIEKP